MEMVITTITDTTQIDITTKADTSTVVNTETVLITTEVVHTTAGDTLDTLDTRQSKQHLLATSAEGEPMRIILAFMLLSMFSNAKPHRDVVKTAKNYLGTKYRFGGTTRKGIDCSGFTKAVMKRHGKKLPRTAEQQASAGKHVDKKNLKRVTWYFSRTPINEVLVTWVFTSGMENLSMHLVPLVKLRYHG